MGSYYQELQPARELSTPLNEALNNMMKEIESGKRKMMDRNNFKDMQPLL